MRCPIPSIYSTLTPRWLKNIFQLGNQACGKILSTFLDGLAFDSDGRYAMVMVDLSVRVGDMVKAVISGAFSRPIMCVGLCEDVREIEFVKNEAIHFIKAKLLMDDGFNVPGFSISPKDAPLEDILVPRPQLRSLAWCGDAIVMKDADCNRWSQHDIFQMQFNALRSAVQHANDMKLQETFAEIKRGADGDGEPPLKKRKEDGVLATLRYIDAESIDTEILQDVTVHQYFPCGKLKATSSNLVLKVCANKALYLVNPDNPVQLCTQKAFLKAPGPGAIERPLKIVHTTVKKERNQK